MTEKLSVPVQSSPYAPLPPGGAAVKAGVQEGDRIIKVWSPFCATHWIWGLSCTFSVVRSAHFFCLAAGQWLVGVLHVPPGGGKANQMWVWLLRILQTPYCISHICCWIIFVSRSFLCCCFVAGPYVAMTLQGPPPSATSLPLEPLPTDLTSNQKMPLGGESTPPPPPPLPSGLSSTPSQRITGPKPLQVRETVLA